MSAENTIIVGEKSAHHYFRDFVYRDSGMIPWLRVNEIEAYIKLVNNPYFYQKARHANRR